MNKSQSICTPSAVNQSDNFLQPDPSAAFQNDAFVHMQANRAVDGMEKRGIAEAEIQQPEATYLFPRETSSAVNAPWPDGAAPNKCQLSFCNYKLDNVP